MRTLVLVFVLSVTSLARAQGAPPIEPPIEPAVEAPVEPMGEADEPKGRSLRDNGKLGAALLGGGAAIAASTAAATSLIDAVTTPDDRGAPLKNPELVQVGGFVTVALMSLSAGVMLLGAALLVDDLANP